VKITKSELKQLVEQEMGITEGWFDNIFKKQKSAPWDGLHGYESRLAYEFYIAVKHKKKRHGPNSILEQYIITNRPDWAVEYADKVIGGRWPEAEETIKKDPKAWKKYCQIFPEAEKEFKNENKIMRITKSELKQMIKEELEDERDENGLLPVGAASRQVDKWDEQWSSAFEKWWKDNSEGMSGLDLDEIARLAFQAGSYVGKGWKE